MFGKLTERVLKNKAKLSTKKTTLKPPSKNPKFANNPAGLNIHDLLHELSGRTGDGVYIDWATFRSHFQPRMCGQNSESMQASKGNEQKKENNEKTKKTNKNKNKQESTEKQKKTKKQKQETETRNKKKTKNYKKQHKK